jgi:formyl-CoA transferase
MWTLLNKFAEKYTKQEFMKILNELDVPGGPIMSTEDLANDQHVRGREMWVELDHPPRGKWFKVGMPIKLSASPAVIKRSPTLGEHTDEILQEVLGYEKEKIARLKSAGAFSVPPKKAAGRSRSSASRTSAKRCSRRSSRARTRSRACSARRNVPARGPTR